MQFVSNFNPLRFSPHNKAHSYPPPPTQYTGVLWRDITIDTVPFASSEWIDFLLFSLKMVACRSGTTLVSINEVKQRSLWIVMGWVTAYEYHRRTRPGHPYVGRQNGGAARLRPIAVASYAHLRLHCVLQAWWLTPGRASGRKKPAPS